MLRRNWLELARKKVDRYDLDYSFNAVQAALGEAALSYWGEGVLTTTIYPNPFPITMSNALMGGSVGPGIGHDPNGQITRIDPNSPTSPAFTVAPADPQNPRADLLVIRYVQTGDTEIPEPSAPLTTIPLNLHDDFELVVLTGTPSSSPSYPVKGATDLILAGLIVPAGAAVGTQINVDLSVRELASPDIAKLPVFEQEVPAGNIDGQNLVYTLSQTPLRAGLIIFVDGLPLAPASYTLNGQSIGMLTPLNPGQRIFCFYIASVASSVNPLAVATETPSGIVDGVNSVFTLSGQPASKASMMVFVDGVFTFASAWSLIQSQGQAQIQFQAGKLPQVGQDVLVVYFVNPASVGVAAEANAPMYTRNVYGLPNSPRSFDPAAGLQIGPEADQTWIIGTNGQGALNVTSQVQIGNGQSIGQRITLRGSDQTNYYVFMGAAATIQGNLSLNGNCQITSNQALVLEWDGQCWYEITRRF